MPEEWNGAVWQRSNSLTGTAWTLYRFADWLPAANKEVSIRTQIPEESADSDVFALKKEELDEKAQEKDIEGRSTMSKAELVEALEA